MDRRSRSGGALNGFDRTRNLGHIALLLAGLTLLALAALAHYRGPMLRVEGDEGTFLAMMASLAEDGDLRFDEADLERVRAAEGGRGHLILQRVDGEMAYSKPVVFAVVAAPFYAVFGETGPVVLNVLALALALAVSAAGLRRIGEPGHVALVLVTFVGAAVVVPYLAWRMTDALQASLALTGLMLCFAQLRGSLPPRSSRLDRLLAWEGAPYLGAVLLAVVVNMRVSNGLVAAAPVVAACLVGRFRKAIALAMISGLTFFALAGLTEALTGASNPYRASRTTFTPKTGYPAGEEAAEALPRLEQVQASDRTGLKPHDGPRRIGYSALYFVLGRHTGLAWYFPAALVLLAFALRRPDRPAMAVLLMFLGSVAFFVIWRAENYFGGSTFLGNRYFVPFYPLLIVALQRLPGARWLAVAWALAALSYSSALLSEARYSEIDRTSQSHTRDGIFRLMPYESTARDIGGRRDRYWAGHFLRFVDPFGGVKPWHLELHTGRPATEVQVSHWRPIELLRLFVETTAPEAILEVRDYRRRFEIPIGTAQAAHGPLGAQADLKTSKAWRLHRYWWDAKTLYQTRSLRMRLLAPEGVDAKATVRYFGDPQTLLETFAYHRQKTWAPTEAIAVTTSQVGFQLLNTSPLNWEKEDVVPVRAGYRMFDVTGRKVRESAPIPLPHRVEPYEVVGISVDVPWPSEPGIYRLEVDLVLEHIAWFGQHLGEPVLSQNVEVKPAPPGE